MNTDHLHTAFRDFCNYFDYARFTCVDAELARVRLSEIKHCSNFKRSSCFI